MRFDWRWVGLIFSQGCSWLGLGFRIFCSLFHSVKAQKERHHLRKDCCFPTSVPWYFRAPTGWEVTLLVPQIPPQRGLSLSQKKEFSPLRQGKLLRAQQRCHFSRAAWPGSGAEMDLASACLQLRGKALFYWSKHLCSCAGPFWTHLSVEALTALSTFVSQSKQQW